MKPNETAEILRQFNEWRRGDEDIPQFDPNKIGAAIDAAIGMIDRLEAAEKEVVLKERVIDALGSELNAVANERDELRAAVQHEADCVEAAKAEIVTLCAKIEAMEKQAPVRWGCTVLQVDGSWKEEIGIEEPPKDYFSIRNAFPLYALPGAKGETT